MKYPCFFDNSFLFGFEKLGAQQNKIQTKTIECANMASGPFCSEMLLL